MEKMQMNKIRTQKIKKNSKTDVLQQGDPAKRIDIEHVQYIKLNSHFWINS